MRQQLGVKVNQRARAAGIGAGEAVVLEIKGLEAAM